MTILKVEYEKKIYEILEMVNNLDGENSLKLCESKFIRWNKKVELF